MQYSMLVILRLNRGKVETIMSRISEDNRTASEEVATVLKWSLIALFIVAVIAVGTFLWAFNMLHYQ